MCLCIKAFRRIKIRENNTVPYMFLTNINWQINTKLSSAICQHNMRYDQLC